MHLHTYRDEQHSRHLDLIGRNWSIDLVTVTAAGGLRLCRRGPVGPLTAPNGFPSAPIGGIMGMRTSSGCGMIRLDGLGHKAQRALRP